MTNKQELYKVKDDVKSLRKLFTFSVFLSVSCLVSSFANPLLKLTVYRQYEVGLLGQQREDIYIITEASRRYPYGFIPEKAEVIAQIREDFKTPKIAMLILAALSAAYARSIASEVIRQYDLESRVRKLETTTEEELLIKEIKLNAAILMKEQALEAANKIQGLFGSYGQDSPEYEDAEAAEAIATNKTYLIMDLCNQGHSLEYAIEQVYELKPDTDEFKHVLKKYSEE